MIVNYEYNNSTLLISYIDTKGKLKFKNYKWANPQEWKICSDTDPQKSNKFHTWDKKSVKKEFTRHPTRYAIYEFINNLPQEEKDIILSYQEPNVYFCDIEVEITEGFPEAHLADNKVTAICLIYENKVLLLGIKPIEDNWTNKMETSMNKYFEKFDTNYTINYMYYETEKEMLEVLFNELIPKMPVLTGWNFITYDWVYLVTRARKLGINPDAASPTGKLIKPWSKNAADYKPTYHELPKHRLVFDYMDIFDKWDTSIKIKESNALDFVSSEVLGVKKLEYKGTLKDLYHDDWYSYLLYNCIDTALVQLIHKKQRTFDIMLSMSNLAKIQIEDAPSAIRVTEGILFEDFYNDGIVMVRQNNNMFDNHQEETEIIKKEDELGGGYVKFPSTGLKRWISVFDFASLYPTTMRMFNIGPDSFKGMKINDSETLLNGIKYKLLDDDIVLLNGAVFANNESKTKQILTRIFKDRKTNKNIALDYKKQEQLMKNYLKNRKELK